MTIKKKKIMNSPSNSSVLNNFYKKKGCTPESDPWEAYSNGHLPDERRFGHKTQISNLL